MKYFFLSCLKATELVEKKLNFKLKFKEKLQLIIHKSMCSACSVYDDQIQLIDKALKKKEVKKIDVEEFKSELIEKIN